MTKLMRLAVVPCVLCAGLWVSGCTSEARQLTVESRAPQTVASPSSQSTRQVPVTPRDESDGETIWSGRSGGRDMRWTTADFFVEAGGERTGVLTPLVERGFADFAAVAVDDRPGRRGAALDCSYNRTFRVLSIVGTIVSFEDGYEDDCGGAHPSASTRFTAIDVSKPGAVLYARGKETPMMDADPSAGKIAKLTDYFAERDVLRALLADAVVKRALRESGAAEPKTLADLPRVFAENGYGLGDSGFELRPDFLTRFAFHHTEGDRVAVRLNLPPHFSANRTQHEQFGLLLPVPATLKEALAVAASRQSGFLMKDAEQVADDRIASFSFSTGAGRIEQ